MLKYTEKVFGWDRPMGILQKKLIIIIGLACGMLAYSFYSFIQKGSDPQELNTVNSPADAPSASSTTNTDAEVVVYVSGGVNKPGVYKLIQGSRVVDAVTLAGGFAPGADAAKINLALLTKDEMHINVPYAAVPAATTANSTSNPSHSGSQDDKISINMGSKADLDKLPGIGPSLAERIIEYRTNNGQFKDISELKKVPGIGESKYNQFKNKISL